MTKKKAKSFFVVLNEKGLHTRPSTELVKCAAHFASHIQLYYKRCCVNAKSILGVLTLTAERGAKIGIEAVGEDADKAVEAILRLSKNKFNVRY
jgi:phosphocarrier protein